MIIVITGNGKGKTTSALGTILRALSHGKKVLIIQFMKPHSYEIEFLKNIVTENLQTFNFGLDEFYVGRNKEKHSKEVIKAWNTFLKLKQDYETILLDELNVALHFGFLNLEDVINTIKEFKAKKDVHLLITGRYAKQEIIELADTASEVNEIKHHWKELGTIKGIDF